MNKKLMVLLGGAGAVHLVAGGLFLAGGCAQEDPPMPPGIYVPRHSQTENPSQFNNLPAPADPAGKADLSTEPIAEPAPAKPAAEPAAKDSGNVDQLYVVVKNDSLWLIARKNGLTVEELASYNGLPANAKVRIGQKLYIPVAGSKAIKAREVKKDKSRKKGVAPVGKKKGGTKSAAKPVAKSKLPADGIYTIKPGDNFSFIAKRYGLKVSDLLAANPGIDSSRLKVGQKIRLTADAAAVPAKGKSGKKAAAKKAAAPAAEPKAAPSAETKAPAPAASDDDLLKNVEDIKSDKPADSSAADDALNAVTGNGDPSKTAPEKDQIISAADGQTTVVLGENTTLEAFCKKYRVSADDVKKLNPEIGSGKIKTGTKIRLAGAED